MCEWHLACTARVGKICTMSVLFRVDSGLLSNKCKTTLPTTGCTARIGKICTMSVLFRVDSGLLSNKCKTTLCWQKSPGCTAQQYMLRTFFVCVCNAHFCKSCTLPVCRNSCNLYRIHNKY